MNSTIQKLQIVNDADVVLIDFLVSPHYTTKFTANTPDVRLETAEITFEDGTRVTSEHYDNVTEEITFAFSESTGAVMSARFSTLERVVSDIRRSIEDRSSLFYLKFQPYSDVPAHISQILSLYLRREEPRTDELQQQVMRGDSVSSGSFYSKFTLVLQRVPYWEGPEQVLNVTAQSGSGTEVLINNTDDTAYGNWVTLPALDPSQGGLPTPLKVTMRVSSAFDPAGAVYICNFVDRGNAPVILESEQYSYLKSGASVADANASNGYYTTITTDAGSSVNFSIAWLLTRAQMADMGGKTFHVFCCFRNNIYPATLRAKPQWTRNLGQGGTNPQAELANAYSEHTVSDWGGVVDVGAFRIPPLDQFPGEDIDQGVFGVWMAGISQPLSVNEGRLDFVALFPADGGCSYVAVMFAILVSNPGIVTDQKIVVDGRFNVVHLLGLNSGTYYKQTGAYPVGGPLMYVPGHTNQLHFLFQKLTLGHAPSHATYVSVSLRPRRLFL